MRKRYAISLLIGLACLYLAFRKVEWHDMGQAFRTADYRLIPLFVLGHLAGMFIRSHRWRMILGPVKKAAFRNIFSAVSIGFMANFIFPARAGELIRAYVIGRGEGISKSASLATIILERLFDGFAILLFLALFPIFLEVPHGKEEIMGSIRMAGALAMLFYVIILVILFFFWRFPGPFLRITDRVCARLPGRLSDPLRKIVSSFGGGLDMLGNAGHIISVMAWSILLWSVLGLANWILLIAFELRLPVFAGLFLVVVQSFGTMVPSPGYVGAFHYAHVLGLSLFAVSKEISLSLSILLHGLIFLTYVLLGVAFLWAEGMRLGDVRAQEAGYD